MSWLILHRDGKIETPGVSWGGKLTLVGENVRRKLVAFHIEGGDAWSGQGQPWVYIPAKYVVFTYTERKVEKDRISYHTDDLGSLDFPVRKSPYQVKDWG